jgi:hypothetical protein
MARFCCYCLTIAFAVSRLVAAVSTDRPAVDFNRDIQPILADNCYSCHGPDEKQRKAQLRLDTKEGAFRVKDGRAVIVPGQSATSELYRRISTSDEDDHMPPAKSKRHLTAGQITSIRQWIDQGAPWASHWALSPPARPELSAVKDSAWPRNPIDHFILARLESEGWTPSMAASRETLLRRVTLDLTGLPPTTAELTSFLGDNSSNAYEKVVDHLLASPRFGERMAFRWLEAARYADTSGYQSDGERFMWRWRDWVIDAFNQNKPFDEFTIEQIAGDLLPDSTLAQKIATGFNRNHRGNGEGGIIAEEYAVEYVVDRVDTTATVWLGLTLGCARCHDHKFDPVTQKEFYQMFAFFNNVPEKGHAAKYGNSMPYIQAPTEAQQKQLAKLESELAAAESQWRSLEPKIATAQSLWEKTLTQSPPFDWILTNSLHASFPLDGSVGNYAGESKAPKFVGGELVFSPGRLGQAAKFDGKSFINAGDVAAFGFYDKFSCGAWIFPRDEQGGAILSRMVEAPQGEGYSLQLIGGKVQVHLTKRWLDDALRVETQARLEPNRWHHVMMTYDGSRGASGVTIYIDGKAARIEVLLDELNQSFATKEPLRIGAGGGMENFFKGLIDDVRIYSRALTPTEVGIMATADSISDIAARPALERSASQVQKLRACFLADHAPTPIRQANHQLAVLRERRERLMESFPTTMVMEEMKSPRETFVLKRGEYDKPGEKVTADVPASLARWPAGAPKNRLGLARWLVTPENPLTARVAVNQYWQMLFGAGLVKTAEDFGTQGERPSHPELLDWLATEFIRSGWNIKAILKLMVMSATYQQSAKATPALLQHDPENRLLARGPRARLSAEMIRDQALAISGLLVEKIGGPSVKPYQPRGLWKELSSEADYVQDQGEKLYRRSLYTFWKRTIAPPTMSIFDATGRETCSVRQSRTSTPLQALTLLNEVTYVEAARALAQRMMIEGGAEPEERLAFAFRRALARWPTAAELDVLRNDLRRQLEHYRQNTTAALELLKIGATTWDGHLDSGELAAYTAVASLILNLDETITKP